MYRIYIFVISIWNDFVELHSSVKTYFSRMFYVFFIMSIMILRIF